MHDSDTDDNIKQIHKIPKFSLTRTWVQCLGHCKVILYSNLEWEGFWCPCGGGGGVVSPKFSTIEGLLAVLNKHHRQGDNILSRASVLSGDNYSICSQWLYYLLAREEGASISVIPLTIERKIQRGKARSMYLILAIAADYCKWT